VTDEGYFEFFFHLQETEIGIKNNCRALKKHEISLKSGRNYSRNITILKDLDL